jgi:hypothetical protein
VDIRAAAFPDYVEAIGGDISIELRGGLPQNRGGFGQRISLIRINDSGRGNLFHETAS